MEVVGFVCRDNVGPFWWCNDVVDRVKDVEAVVKPCLKCRVSTRL